jgi:hypothetical protein
MLSHNQLPQSNTRPPICGHICWWNLDTNLVEQYCGNELVESFDVERLVLFPPKNFPQKTFDEISTHYMENFLNDQEEKLKLTNSLETANSLPVTHDIFKSDNLSQEDMKYIVIDRLKNELSNLVNTQGSRYINLLWKDLGVIHYE